MVVLSVQEIALLARPILSEAEVTALESGTLTDPQKATIRDRLERRDKVLRRCCPSGPDSAIYINLKKSHLSEAAAPA